MGEENPFTEADARLGAMHGDAGAMMDAIEAERIAAAKIIVGEAIRRFDAIEAKVDRLETLVRELIVALRSGAVGKWTS